MALFYRNTVFLLVSAVALFFLTGCNVRGEDGDVSDSNSSSEIGSGFVVRDDILHTHAASVVIGQNDFNTSDAGATAADKVSMPYANPTVVDGMLYLPDFGNNRAIGYNSVPTSSGEWADFAVGQKNLVYSYSGTSEYQNSGAKTVTVATGTLFMTDHGNSRILLYARRPISEPAKADIVVGQTDFYQDTPGLADNRLNLPESLCVAGGKLIVADSRNNRVLIWNTIPALHGAAADVVIGQKDFKSNAIVDPPTAASLNFPTAVWSNGTNLIVLDAGNNRILVWDTFPDSNQAADVVLGQADFISSAPNRGLAVPGDSTLSFSADGGGLYANGSQLFVADSGNHRLLVWEFPLTTGEAATGLIGQDGYDRSGANREGATPANNTLSNPTGVYQFYDKLIVTDTGNNRYLIFESE